MPEIEDFSNIDENAILKEVWNTIDIKAKTELTPTQIMSINKLSTLSNIFGNKLLEKHLEDYMILQKSKNRKSMSEFVEIVKKKFSDNIGEGGLFGKLMG